MKKVTRLSILYSTLIFIAACGNKSNSNSTANPIAAQQTEKKKDLSLLGVEMGLKTKYSRLQFVCQKSGYSDHEQGFRGRIGHEEIGPLREVVWDILKDYSDAKKTTLSLAVDDFKLSLDLDLKLKMDSVRVEETNSHIAFFIKNAASLTGTSSFVIVENSTTPKSIRIETGKVTFFDRVESPFLDTTFGAKYQQTNFQISCVIEADVRMGYQDEYQVAPK